MDSDALVTLGLALVCLFAVGSAAGSLESAVDSSPSEAIDLDYSSLPLDKGDANDIKREYQTLTDNPSQQEHGGEQSSQSGQSSASGPDDGDDDSTSDSSTDSSDAQRDQSSGSNETPGERDGLEALIDALLALLSRLVELVVGVVAVVALALVARYRDRIAARLSPIVARFRGGESPAEERAGGGVDAPPEPENEVTEAWYEMVERLRLDDRQLLTPRERAAIARENGADANSVWSLTELFEEVRYGGAPVTEDRRRRARECLERLGPSGGRDQS
ncbi:hypothetical protein DEQ92_16285 [Haloferax sp. Atlit-6N]|uniref:DUF4129 domain-containing protein n=1 Tax=unclassified Haloferax TaxID=2625095 RepID=UPI000E2781EE|nr:MULTISPECIES: DUF4129 domain-containing protein [unclassified Haloferax]RDZ50866.1 hypothetical protein C5C07_18850 [Haloferax sp. Atlit-4N]REA01468.1 hypothetical protein DEQ92_16285 [Haloferax sp. Atlit-6N]